MENETAVKHMKRFAGAASAMLCAIASSYAVAPQTLQADSITTAALSTACICSGTGSDLGSPEGGYLLESDSLAYSSSGPYALTGPGGSDFNASGWASADTLGTLRAYAYANAGVLYKQSSGSGSSYWTDTVQASCDPLIIGTATCNASGQVEYKASIELDDSISSANYGQYGGGGFAHFFTTGSIVGAEIDDSTRNGVDSLAVNRSDVIDFFEPVGTFFTIGAELDTLSSAQEGFSLVDASATGLFSLQVVTPGGGYAEPNGIVFASSLADAAAAEDAPEPGTIGLALLGCVFLALSARKPTPTSAR